MSHKRYSKKGVRKRSLVLTFQTGNLMSGILTKTIVQHSTPSKGINIKFSASSVMVR